MGFLKFILWTSCAIAIGVGIATWEVDGRTPLEHGERAWKRTGSTGSVKSLASDLGESMEDAIDSAKDTLGAKNPGAPRESYRAEDRAAVEQLISQRAKKQ